MNANSYIGYLNYIVFLFLASGLFIVSFDVRHYKDNRMPKERRAAAISGWMNLVLGAVVYIGSWLYKKYFW
ncbi:CLC_0170 family protein [Paenibacillus flagellatus]|uniref:Uncharacterized protein n=1 Tax=Paenibacillus flagellatus TaxID=2211139 RepID=A0A2V5KBP7_9BACL|nr:CLC_0170 family protein [Paenibacillus flagellatus]PYI56878.1 hypothetical protein DLM86_00035 [Paenibacillus flagellatus]